MFSVRSWVVSGAAVAAIVVTITGVAHRAKPPAPHFVIVRDVSASIPRDCDGEIGIVEHIYSRALAQRGSTLTLMATGSRANEQEPQQLLRTRLPRNVSAVHRGRFAREKRALRDSIKKKCSEYPVTVVSPIYQAVKRAVQHLRSLGCGSGAPCTIFVRTDGRETVEPLVRDSLHAPSKRILLPQAVESAEIEIVFCGIAQTIIGPDSKPSVPGRMRWR